MAVIKPTRIIDVEAVHKFCTIRFQCLDQDMVMIIHQNVCMKSHRIDFRRFCKQENESVSIVIASKNLLFSVSTTHHVIISSGELNSQRPSHMVSIAVRNDLSIVKT
jgi:hypothetical protein